MGDGSFVRYDNKFFEFEKYTLNKQNLMPESVSSLFQIIHSDEFVNEVSDLANFGQLNVYKNNVEWSGVVVDYDVEFYYTIGESNGIYISGEMMKLDENLLDMITKLQTYYEKFKSKWAKVLAARKKTSQIEK